MKTWNVRPDGSPSGDLEMWEELNENADGQHSTVHTKENPDGTWTVTTKVWDASGNFVREDQTTQQPAPVAAPAAPTATRPITPTLTAATDAARIEISGTSRLPEPSLAMGAGWAGAVPPAVVHITDRWHEYPPGVTTYLGSEAYVEEH
jgi:hypothetical protein